MTTTASTENVQDRGPHCWLVMHDDPESEDWIGGEDWPDDEPFDPQCDEWPEEGMTDEQYMELMRSATVGGRMRIDSSWLLAQSTRTTDPTELPDFGLNIDESVRDLFGRTLEQGRLLRVRPTGETDGKHLEVEVRAVHELADFHALPGTPVRRLLDFLIRPTAAEPDPCNAFHSRAPLDGHGDPVGARSEYQRQGEIARRRSAELGLPHDWSIDCVFPHEVLYALQARGRWDQRWTPDGYQRIAGRFTHAFGLPPRPDDPVSVEIEEHPRRPDNELVLADDALQRIAHLLDTARDTNTAALTRLAGRDEGKKQ